VGINRITGVPFWSPPHQQRDVSVPSKTGLVSARRVVSRRAKRWRRVLLALVVIIGAFCVATARLFIWPVQGMPPQVSAIVMLDGPGSTLDVAVRLAVQHKAPFLVVSQGTPASRDPCPRPIPGVTLICFNPVPATTQGEAEFVGRLATKYRWHSMVVVTVTPQASRARLRMERCFGGEVYTATAPLTRSTWPYQIAYEWGALAKALVVQRSC
jgi:uncharacterized SAM-binding protein YcdF (DUF218 family)